MVRHVWLFIILIMTIAGTTLGGVKPVQASDNLLANAGFEDVEYAAPLSWSLDLWDKTANATRASVEAGQAHSGSGYATLENVQPNDAKWVQTVKVKPKTTYRLSGWIKVLSAGSSGKGANLSVLGVLETSKEYAETGGEWKPVELYGKTGAKQEELQVAVRLGGYGSLNVGKAYFDDIALEEVAAAPAGVKPISFEPLPVAPPPTGDATEVSSLPIMAKAVLYAILFAVVYIAVVRRPDSRLLAERGLVPATTSVLGAAFVLRILIAAESGGYPVDMNTFMAWAAHAASDGLPNFYNGEMFADYPPGYIYVLYVVGKLAASLGVATGSDAMRLLVRLPAMLADLGIGLLLVRIGASRGEGRLGLALALLYVLNPAVWVNSASWGQVDSVFTLALLGSLVLLAQGRTNGAALLFAVTVLIKPQALIFTPVFVFTLIVRRAWRQLGIGVLCGLAAFAVLIVPFSLHQPLTWIFDLYRTTLQSYPYATLNAFNLFALAGANWKASDAHTLLLSYNTWGTLFMAATVAAAAAFFFRKRDNPHAKLVYTALLLIVGVYVLGVKMHERYLYPAIALSMLAFLFGKDRRLLYLSLGFSLTQYVNVAYVLGFGMKNESGIPAFDGVLLMTSAANVLLLAFTVRVGYDLWVKGRQLPVTEIGAEEDAMAGTEMRVAATALQTEAERSKGPLFNKKDWKLLTILMLVYSALALYHLGSLKAPQTYWQPEKIGQEAVLDFGAPHTLARLNSFPGVGDGKYEVAFSTDGLQWANPVTIEANYTKDFTWVTNDLNVTARYAKITAESTSSMLHEVAFYEQGQELPLAVADVQGEGAGTAASGDPFRLVDEPDQTVYKPSYLYGTYFDEIYHARTAFEHLHGIKPYETTHPPLGKLLIGVGIAVFGMNPFGWRIVGTLFGIAMIPIMYAFGKRLFGRTEWAFLSAFLFTFDFMHFAQTRISTIDVYGVFFIMLMFYYMYRYMTMSFYDEPLGKTLKPLFWSGFWFGIGAASKWIVLYGGAGLAFLFFYTLYMRYREHEAAKKLLARGQQASKGEPRDASLLELYRRRIELFWKQTWKTVAFCVLTFVLIPAIVYSASFLPALTSKGETLSVKRLIEYQTSMYDYHSKLKATHSFASTWYEWPTMVKPIWYYTGSFVAPGNKSSIVSMGNPAVWWFGLAAVILSLALAWRDKHRGMLVVLTAYFSQYVPWMLVTRLTFIYHYFAMVPFMVLCIVYVLKTWRERTPAARKWIYGYAALTLVLFAMFYPALSGLEVSKIYIDYGLRWFPGWYF